MYYSSYFLSHIQNQFFQSKDVTRNMQWWLRFGDQLFGIIIMSFQKYPEAGAFTSVYCAASPDVLSLSGGYFVNSEIRDLEKCAIDPEVSFIYILLLRSFAFSLAFFSQPLRHFLTLLLLCIL